MLSPLARALPAMTALQAVVAIGTFSLSALAPQLGVSVGELALLNSVLFTTGAITALLAGRLLARWGDWNVAALCAVAVAAGMLCLASGLAWAPWCAVLLVGLAFGPETPASAAVLTRITPARSRPWVFSVRQTGNQIGALTGSLVLPVLLAMHDTLPFAAVAALAVGMAAWCLWLRRDGRLAAPVQALGSHASGGAFSVERAALRRLFGAWPLRLLALAVLVYTALQMCLNTFLMSLAVRDWQLPVATAAAGVAGLQFAGLAGRLFWGWAGQRSGRTMELLGVLGVSMATSGAALMAGPAVWPPGVMVGLLALLGFTASGWNGVLVAEVSRQSEGRDSGALTGAVIMFGYAGLALAPLGFAGLSGALSMAGAFDSLCGAAGGVGLLLLIRTYCPRPPAS